MKNAMQMFATVSMCLGFLVVTGYAVYTSHSQAELLVGALIGFAGQGVSYWLGSSQGSNRKTELMNQTAEAVKPEVVA